MLLGEVTNRQSFLIRPRNGMGCGSFISRLFVHVKYNNLIIRSHSYCLALDQVIILGEYFVYVNPLVTILNQFA